MLEAAVLADEHELARELAARLAGLGWLADAGWFGPSTCIGRHVGAVAAIVGDRVSARRYYGQALETAEKIRFRPEIALTRLQMAELCFGEEQGTGNEEQGRRESLAHLNFCIPELREMKMRPALERALRLRERLSG